MTNRNVAAAMFMSPKTVEANLARICAKMGIQSRTELGLYVGQSGGYGNTRFPLVHKRLAFGR